MKKILIMGLPGAGKTFLANKLVPMINAIWLNADTARREANDWDFSKEGRKRQAKRMNDLALKALKKGQHVIADFICPTSKARKAFKADYTVWVDTIKKGKFEDTNEMFEQPKKYNFRVTTKNAELWAIRIADQIQPYKWKNRKSTGQMLGRWQPFHDAHYALFEEVIKKTGQVCILVRDVKGVGDNPFNFEMIKSRITKRLEPIYKNRFKIMLVPNITNICYGRGVGYKIEQILLSKKMQNISGTKIRKVMRRKGELK